MRQSLLFVGIMLNVLASTAAAPVPTQSSATAHATTAASSPPTIGNATPAANVAPRATPLVITDDTGKTVTLPATPARIVSLAPSATEMLFAAGAGKHAIA